MSTEVLFCLFIFERNPSVANTVLQLYLGLKLETHPRAVYAAFASFPLISYELDFLPLGMVLTGKNMTNNYDIGLRPTF